jgi:hypothetical protein
MVQEGCFRYYWEGAHPNAGMAIEILPGDENLVAVGASGHGIMTLLVGVERGFITREQGVERLLKITRFLTKADRFHGAFPHFLDGRTGKTIARFGKYDDGGDLVETSSVRRVLLCSGKIYFDLEAERRKRGVTDVYILRLEQLYPFPAKALALELNRFGTAEICWCQEEPKNMGAWSFVESYVEWSSGQGRGLAQRPSYIGRPASAATATGHISRHIAELQAIMDRAFATG